MGNSTQGHQGNIKQRPEDFCVDEIPLYAPSGEGEHLYLGIQKTNVSHDEMVIRLAKAFKVSKRSIGTAGRKDRLAVTTQVVSIHLPTQSKQIPELDEGLHILWNAQHNNKLRLGHLIGNRFDIRIRGIDSIKVTSLNDKFVQLKNEGMPNAYGPQRFGNRQNNHLVGLAYLKQDWQEMQRVLDVPKGMDSLSPEAACKLIHKSKIILYVQALQSYLFNQVLEARLKDGSWCSCHVGDLAWSHVGKGSSFLVTKEELQTKDIQERTQQLLLSPTGPMWGLKMRMPEGEIATLEESLLEESELSLTDFASVKHIAKGARRPLRVPIEQTSISGGVDEHGDFIRVQFELPSGSYATVLVDELLSVLS